MTLKFCQIGPVAGTKHPSKHCLFMVRTTIVLLNNICNMHCGNWLHDERLKKTSNRGIRYLCLKFKQKHFESYLSKTVCRANQIPM